MKDYFTTLITVTVMIFLYVLHIWLIGALTVNGHYVSAILASAAFITTMLHTIEIAEWIEWKLP